MWEPQPPKTLWASTAYYRDNLTLPWELYETHKELYGQKPYDKVGGMYCHNFWVTLEGGLTGNRIY
jgi:hypothetical protein